MRVSDRPGVGWARKTSRALTSVAIYLVGDSSRTPRVSTVIRDRFGRPASVLGDPKAVTALGAASTYAQRVAKRAHPDGVPVNGVPNEQVVVRASESPTLNPPAPQSSPELRPRPDRGPPGRLDVSP